MNSQANMLDYRNSAAAFLVLAVPFYINDFAFIALNGTYGVYLADYATRLCVLTLCFFWPVSRTIATKRMLPQSGVGIALLCVVMLPALGRLTYHQLEALLVQLTGLGGLFQFHHLANPTLYWLDLTVGLFAVALSEELVFRKFALHWLERAGRTPVQIVFISALFFSLMHWGSGPGRLLHTFAVGLIYMAAYLHIRRLWPLVAAHWIEDFAALGPYDL